MPGLFACSIGQSIFGGDRATPIEAIDQLAADGMDPDLEDGEEIVWLRSTSTASTMEAWMN